MSGSAKGTPATRAPSLWHHSDFVKLLTGQAVGQLGTQVTLLAVPLTAILVLHASAFEVGLLSTVEYLPFILFGLPAGVWVDLLPRRPVLVAADVGRFLALGSIPLADHLGLLGMGQLYIVAFVTGTFTVFFDVAYQSYLPSLVERGQLMEGNAKLQAAYSGAQLAGPGLGGALVGLLTAPIAILADSLSYVVSTGALLLIRAREAVPPRPARRERRLRAGIAEGLAYIARHPYLRPIAACTATANLFGAMSQAVLLLFAVRTLGLTPAVVGGVLTAANAGFLAGALVARRMSERVGMGTAIVGSAALFAAGGALFPLATKAMPFPFLVAAGLALGFGGAGYNLNQVTLRQAITPDRLQGRMNATMRFLVWGTIPLGSLVGGALGSTIGLRPTLVVAAAGGCLAVPPVLLSPVRSLRTIPDVSGDGEGPVGVDEGPAADAGFTAVVQPPAP